MEAVEVKGEKGEQVSSKCHLGCHSISYIDIRNMSNLEGEREVLQEWQQVDEVGGDQGEEEHDVGDPQVDVVEEELPQGLAEHRAELQARRVLHHPGNEGLQPADCCLHG